MEMGEGGNSGLAIVGEKGCKVQTKSPSLLFAQKSTGRTFQLKQFSAMWNWDNCCQRGPEAYESNGKMWPCAGLDPQQTPKRLPMEKARMEMCIQTSHAGEPDASLMVAQIFPHLLPLNQTGFSTAAEAWKGPAYGGVSPSRSMCKP